MKSRQAWLGEQLSQSKADWQVAVTHFPCGHEQGFWISMHQTRRGRSHIL